MKANSAHSANRCQHRTRTGRQCCSPAAAPNSLFCARHSLAQTSDTVDFTVELTAPHHFQRAQQVNRSLIALYRLLAAGRISPRRASVLAYIANLMLNTLKAIDYDLARFPNEAIAGALKPASDAPQLPTAEPVTQLGTQASAQPPAQPTAKPLNAPVAQPIGPGTQPLPATGKGFVAEVLKLKPN